MEKTNNFRPTDPLDELKDGSMRTVNQECKSKRRRCTIANSAISGE